MMKMRYAMAAVGLAVLAPGALADTVTASFVSELQKQIEVEYTGVHSGSVQTVTFHWTRTDAPGPGIDTQIAPLFTTYCIEIDQHVAPSTGYTYNVIDPAAHGFTGQQIMLLGRLWSSFQGLIDTENESAAFQAAVWEIAFDTGADLEAGVFTVTSTNAVRTLAQGYLNDVTSGSYSGGQTELLVLQHPSAQNQLTAVPTPGALALSGLAGLTVCRRRRR